MYKIRFLDGSTKEFSSLVNVNLNHADLSNVDLSNLDLSNARLRCANLNNVGLSNAALIRANLSHVILNDVDLSNADLGYADLGYADLSCVNLRNISSGNRKEIKTISCFSEWQIVYTSEVLAIGCQQHKIEDWRYFSDMQISDMDDAALSFWKQNKKLILDVVDHTA